MSVAAAADVAALLARELDTAETELAERRLEQVERMIVRRIPDLLERITDGHLESDDVRDIEAEAVYRVMRNPEGLYSEQDGQYGYQRTREAADNTLRILAEEWAVLGIKPSRMFVIAPNLVTPQRDTPFNRGG